MSWQAIQKQIFYILPMLLIVHLLTFTLFFVVNSPDDIARAHLGRKYVSLESIKDWKKTYALDQPRFYNSEKSGWQHFTNTVFFKQTWDLLQFDFGISLNGENINDEIKARVMPSLAIAVPALFATVLINIVFAMMLVFFRNTHLNQVGLIVSIAMLSISTLFYIIFSQYYFAFMWKWFPISGYASGWNALYFIALPVIVHIFSGFGRGVRWCRTLMLEEIEQFYVYTARANGLKQYTIMLFYVLRNCLLPLSTAIVVEIPLLFLGSVLYESFFAIPGLGNYLIHALQQQDFMIVRAMVLLGSLAYMLGLILTDLIYIFVDPRVRIS